MFSKGTGIILTAGAALRLTRFLTRDDLGHWLIKGRWQRYALAVETNRLAVERGRLEHASTPEAWVRMSERYDRATDSTHPEPYTVEQKISHGLDCPYCTGVWVALAVGAVSALASTTAPTKRLWGWLSLGLTTSFVSGAIINAMDRLEAGE